MRHSGMSPRSSKRPSGTTRCATIAACCGACAPTHATSGYRCEYNEGPMVKRLVIAVVAVIQIFGAGAITLAHARDIVVAPAAIEAHHDARCAILHDELRCALGHYAGARIVVPQTLVAPDVGIAALQFMPPPSQVTLPSVAGITKIGRASCRERV